jgi:hypothetical protein
MGKNSIKIIISLFVIMASSCLLIAQNQSNIDARLLKKFPQERLDNLAINSPEVLEREMWMLENSYQIITVSNEKAAYLPPLKRFCPENKIIGNDVQNIDLQNFNIYEVHFERFDDKPSLYRIGDTGQVISFHSFQKLTNEFNKYRDE